MCDGNSMAIACQLLARAMPWWQSPGRKSVVERFTRALALPLRNKIIETDVRHSVRFGSHALSRSDMYTEAAIAERHMEVS